MSPRGDGEYDLVCGQGRLEIFIAKGEKVIPAKVVEMPLEDRLLQSLVENLARRKRSPVEMVRDFIHLRDAGRTPAQIAADAGLSEKYVAGVIKLLETGEQRLVGAVERGDIPISVALEIAASDDAAIQKSMQEAYESGKLRGKPFLRIRRLVEERRLRGKAMKGRGARVHTGKAPSAGDLIRTLQRETQKRELLVRKAHVCEQQLRFVVTAFRDLRSDENFVTLLRAEQLDAMHKVLAEAIGA